MQTREVRQIVGLIQGSDKLEKPLELSWYEFAVMLLEIGASIEHALMVQYLYAAYSLRADHAKAKQWRKTLLTIAREEMGHLLTVQNILTLLRRSVSTSIAGIIPGTFRSRHVPSGSNG